jgi:hypothetical protein
MFEFYGFDPKTLTNEQLFETQLALTGKKIMAARFGKVDLLNQLQMVIQAIDLERRERMFQEQIGSYLLASSSVVIETEVDLQEKIQPQEEANTEKTDVRPIRRPHRTAHPVKDNI